MADGLQAVIGQGGDETESLRAQTAQAQAATEHERHLTLAQNQANAPTEATQTQPVNASSNSVAAPNNEVPKDLSNPNNIHDLNSLVTMPANGTQNAVQPQQRSPAATVKKDPVKPKTEVTGPGVECKEEKGKNSCNVSAIKVEAKVGGDAYSNKGEKGEIAAGSAEANAKFEVSKEGVSAGAGGKGTAVKAKVGNDAISAEGKVLDGSLSLEGTVSPSKVSVNACIKGDAVSGGSQISTLIPLTDFKIKVEGDVGVGGAACVNAEVSKKRVGAKVELGLGPKAKVGVAIERRDENEKPSRSIVRDALEDGFKNYFQIPGLRGY